MSLFRPAKIQGKAVERCRLASRCERTEGHNYHPEIMEGKLGR